MDKKTIDLIRMVYLFGLMFCYLVLLITGDYDGASIVMMNLVLGTPTMFYLMFVVTKNREPYHIFACLLGIPLFMFMIIDIVFLTISGSWKTALERKENGKM